MMSAVKPPQIAKNDQKPYSGGNALELAEPFGGDYVRGYRRGATGRCRRAQLPNLSQALLQALKLRTDLRFHGVS